MNVGQAVMVDDFQDLGFLQTGDGLSPFVVIHQDHPLAPGTEQVILIQKSGNFSFSSRMG